MTNLLVAVALRYLILEVECEQYTLKEEKKVAGRKCRGGHKNFYASFLKKNSN